MNLKRFLLFASLLFSVPVIAQDDLLNLLGKEDSTQAGPVMATFKTTRIINAQSLETVKARTLDFRVSHRFGSVGASAGGGAHNLYGLDNSADIRIAFEYGITDRLTFGLSRSKRQERIEGLAKYRLLRQTTDDRVPIAITVFSSVAFTPEQALAKEYDHLANRFSYTFEAMIGRKFSGNFSLQVMPAFVHHNFVRDPGDTNNLFALGIGGRLKISRSTALIADYYTSFPGNKARNKASMLKNVSYYSPFGAGVEIETGGHVFTLMLSNSAGFLESDFLTQTTDSWLTGGFKLSFNISRNFSL